VRHQAEDEGQTGGKALGYCLDSDEAQRTILNLPASQGKIACLKQAVGEMSPLSPVEAFMTL
jgi:hypothetical protein